MVYSCSWCVPKRCAYFFIIRLLLYPSCKLQDNQFIILPLFIVVIFLTYKFFHNVFLNLDMTRFAFILDCSKNKINVLIVRKIRYTKELKYYLICQENCRMWVVIKRQQVFYVKINKFNLSNYVEMIKIISEESMYQKTRSKSVRRITITSCHIKTTTPKRTLSHRDLTKNIRHVLKPPRNRGKPRYRSRF